jgi:hypothetical protein
MPVTHNLTLTMNTRSERILCYMNVQSFLGFLFLLLCTTKSKHAYN